MLPTQPTSHWGRWTVPPEMSYSFKHRMAWPTMPEAAAAASEATGAAAAARMVGTGAAGIPPHIPQINYYSGGYGSPYGRGWYRRGFGFRRFIWFGLGAWAATAWIRHKEKRQERERYIEQSFSHGHGGNSGNNVPPSVQGPDGWGWKNNFYRPLPVPVDHTATQQQQAPAVPVDFSPPTPTSTPSPPPTLQQYQEIPPPKGLGSPIVNESRRGWGRRWGRPQTEAQAQAQTPAPAQAAKPETVVLPETTKQATTSTGEDEMQKLRETVEKIWEEKKRNVAAAQEVANEKAKEFAREKVERLSAALEALRESLREDSKPEGPKKLV